MQLRARKNIVVLSSIVAGALLVFLAAVPSRAQSGGPDDTVRFKITSGGRDLYKLAIPMPSGDQSSAATAMKVATNDLELSGFPVGMATRTLLLKAEITLWRRETERFWLDVGRSFAPYVAAALTQSAADQEVG